jgi:hypothetical protein
MPDILPSVGGDNGPREVVPVMLFGPTGGYAGTRQLYPLGYLQVSLSTTTVNELPDPPAGTTIALLKIEGAAARYRDDGQDPTAMVGMPIAVGESLVYDALMIDMRLIAQADGAKVNVAYYGSQANA